MLSEKNAKIAITIMMPIFITLFSIFVCAKKVPEMQFYKSTLESLDDSKGTVMALSAATLATSVAITILPDDYATPIADSLADMNQYFIIILAAVLLEKILAVEGANIAFVWIIPIACAVFLLGFFLQKDEIKQFAKKLVILAFAIILVVPCATHLSDAICANQLTYVSETVEEISSGSETINEITQDTTGDESVFDKISNAFKTAITGIADMVDYFSNSVKQCINAVAILIVTTCVIPLLVFVFFMWLLKQLFYVQPVAINKIRVPKFVHASKENKEED